MKRDLKHVQSRLAFMCLERSQTKKSLRVIFNNLKNIRLSQLAHCSNSGGRGGGRHVEASAILSKHAIYAISIVYYGCQGNRLPNTGDDEYHGINSEAVTRYIDDDYHTLARTNNMKLSSLPNDRFLRRTSGLSCLNIF